MPPLPLVLHPALIGIARVFRLCGRSPVMEKYRCTVCGYIYDPAVGDSTQGIAAGTAFANLPDSWVCPECGVAKDMFEKI
jgi:rubredoxin